MATYPTVELYVNSAWTDITSYVRYSNMIEITRGQSGEGSTTETSTCKLTLDNTDGRFSPRNPTGTYYGQIGRNTPIRVSLDGGETYLDLPGTASDGATTPDHADLDITGDIDIRMELSLDDWDGGANSAELIGKFGSAGQRSWLVYLTGNGQIAYRWSADGTATTEVQSDSIYFPRHHRRAIRITHDVNDGSGNNVVTFYTSDAIDGTWETVSVETTAGTTSIFSSTATLEIGELSGLAGDLPLGKVYKASVRTGIAGTEVANPDFTAQAAGASSFADAAGRTWTIQSGASIKNRKVRFTGEVSSWPATSDISGKDKTVSVEAAGILRRLTQGASPLDSAMLRFIKTQDNIHECWTLTDGTLSTYAEPMYDGTTMQVRYFTGSNRPEWGEGSLAEWIEPVVRVPPDVWGDMRGYVANQSAAASGWSVEFCYAGIQDFSFLVADRGDLTDDDPRVAFRIELDQSADSLLLTSISAGETTISSTLEETVTSSGLFDGEPHHIRLTLANSGANALYQIYIDGVEVADNTAPGRAVEALLYVQPEWDTTSITGEAPSIGFISYLTGSSLTALQSYNALIGHRGETAGTRIARLCEEEGITYQRIGTGTTPAMRPQGLETLVDLLREAEAADLGILYEPREFIGLSYKDRTVLENQSVKLALTYSDHELAQSLAPVEDDQSVRNDVTVTQLYGSTYRTTLDTGTLSTQSPPNGVGRYTTSVTASLDDLDDLPQYANWLLHLGTVDEARYPTMAINLRHSTFTASTAMMEDALTMDVGDRMTVDGIPSWWPPDTINQLSIGFSEQLGIRERDIVVNCSPASPYHVGEVEATEYERVDTDGCTIIEDLTTTETDVNVLTQIGSAQWMDSATYSSQFPFDVKCGGEVMTVTACTHGLSDDFSANQTDSWGSADVGGTWNLSGGTVGGDYDVAGGVGTHLLASTNTSRRSFLTAPHADFDIYCDVATSALATGASLHGGIMARYVDASNMYMSQLEFTTSNTIILTIRERAAAVESTLGSAVTLRLTHVAGTYYRIRFQGEGTALRAKAWLTTDLEPGPWQVETTDSTLTSAGSIGCRSIATTGNTNVSPVVSYDNFALINPQVMTVTRSVNGVVKAHSSGADIRLYDPAIVAF